MKLTAMSGDMLLCAPSLPVFVVVIVWVCAPLVTVDVKVGRTALKDTLCCATVLNVTAPSELVVVALWLFVVEAGVV